MMQLFSEIHKFMNYVKGFTVGYSISDRKMMFEYNGKRFVAEFREVVAPAENMIDDMRRIKYL